METETTPVTALEGLKIVIPQILAWRADAVLLEFVNTPSNFLAIDGKDSNWSFLVYSLKSNKIAIFIPFRGKTEEYPAGKYAKEHIYWKLDFLESVNLLDSDKLAEKLEKLGTIENRSGQLWVRVGGFSNWTGKPGHPQWSGYYYNIADKLTWHMLVDMQTGEISLNERDKIQNMGMTSYLRQITPDELDQYLNTSVSLEIWHWEPGTISVTSFADLLKLLTGSSKRMDTPLYKAIVRGGKCLGEPCYNTNPDVYIGYTYYLTSQEVNQLASEVLNVTLERLVDKLEETILDNEVNETWDNYEFLGDPERLVLEFKALRDFYQVASQKGNAVLLSVLDEVREGRKQE